MQWTSIVAIYGLFWALSAFLVMPFGVQTPNDVGCEVIKGHADSAPINFRPKLIAGRATVLAFVLFGAFYANYIQGWITVDDVNLFRKSSTDEVGY